MTRWHLDEPAASYLVTVAIGDFEETQERSESGVPLTYWTPRDQPRFVRRLEVAADELDWIEESSGRTRSPRSASCSWTRAAAWRRRR